MSDDCHWSGTEGEELRLNLHIQVRARQDEVCGIHAGRLRVRIKAPPVDGKANSQLLRFLAEAFGVTRSQVRIVSGLQGRDKSVTIHAPKRHPDWYLKLTGGS